MSNNKIPTAEELLENYRFEAGEHIGNRDYDLMCSFAIKFAKLHVEAALDAASRAKTNYRSRFLITQDIINAYPLENIK